MKFLGKGIPSLLYKGNFKVFSYDAVNIFSQNMCMSVIEVYLLNEHINISLIYANTDILGAKLLFYLLFSKYVCLSACMYVCF